MDTSRGKLENDFILPVLVQLLDSQKDPWIKETVLFAQELATKTLVFAMCNISWASAVFSAMAVKLSYAFGDPHVDLLL